MTGTSKEDLVGTYVFDLLARLQWAKMKVSKVKEVRVEGVLLFLVPLFALFHDQHQSSCVTALVCAQ